jgi:hypothetical protein
MVMERKYPDSMSDAKFILVTAIVLLIGAVSLFFYISHKLKNKKHTNGKLSNVLDFIT